jgi:hypothetical protein
MLCYSKVSVGAMLTHVAKLTLKTLVEEVRMGTFSRAGFQQVQVDTSMLRWLLPAVLALRYCREQVDTHSGIGHARTIAL